MAQLPPDGNLLIQQVNGRVVLFERYTERELVSFDPTVAMDVAQAQRLIHECEELTDEQKAFANFWSGYFYAYSCMNNGSPAYGL